MTSLIPKGQENDSLKVHLVILLALMEKLTCSSGRRVLRNVYFSIIFLHICKKK